MGRSMSPQICGAKGAVNVVGIEIVRKASVSVIEDDAGGSGNRAASQAARRAGSQPGKLRARVAEQNDMVAGGQGGTNDVFVTEMERGEFSDHQAGAESAHGARERVGVHDASGGIRSER